jgi:hypothetical protein
MGIIMINCPATGRRVSTGIETVDIEELPAVTAKMSRLWWCARLDQSTGVARTQRRAVPIGSDGGASDLTVSLAGTLNSGQAKGRGIRRALRLEPPAGCHVLGCGTIRM